METGRNLRSTKKSIYNKWHILGANFYNAVDMMKSRLSANAVVLQLPIGKEDDFVGIVDLLNMDAIIYKDDKGVEMEETEIPEDMKEMAQEWREKKWLKQ